MARTRIAPWDYDKRDRRRTDAEDEILATDTLNEVKGKLGDTFDEWAGKALTGKSWWEKFHLATDMLACIARSDDEADQRQTLNDARGF